MPLPSDEKILALSNDLIAQFQQIFGAYPGVRPAHAKGVMLTGTFTPTAAAAGLSKAPHFAAETPVTARFSNSTGLPLIPDNDPNSNPKGLAVRFNLGEHVHTDIVAHSTDGFPTRTGQEFLDFLRAVAASAPGTPSPTPIEQFLGGHPAALAFVQAPKPFPVSFGTDTYFGVTAMQFTNADGKIQFGRYRILPVAGNEYLDDEAAKAKGADYLVDEIGTRVASGPVTLKVYAQLAAAGDVVDDATIHWPEDRELLELGTISLTAMVADTPGEQKHIIFDPIPRVEGIEPSEDPLLELRAAVYLISGRKRRSA